MLDGAIGLRVPMPTLGFGAAQLGNLFRETSDEEAAQAVSAAWESGIRYYDTAPHYGLGLSERRLGAALAGRRRDEVLISTKVGRLLVPSPDTAGRLDHEGFAVPAGNAGLPRPEIWSVGWRNPWKFSFDQPSRGAAARARSACSAGSRA